MGKKYAEKFASLSAKSKKSLKKQPLKIFLATFLYGMSVANNKYQIN
jgi:hypothetical protein